MQLLGLFTTAAVLTLCPLEDGKLFIQNLFFSCYKISFFFSKRSHSYVEGQNSSGLWKNAYRSSLWYIIAWALVKPVYSNNRSHSQWSLSQLDCNMNRSYQSSVIKEWCERESYVIFWGFTFFHLQNISIRWNCEQWVLRVAIGIQLWYIHLSLETVLCR